MVGDRAGGFTGSAQAARDWVQNLEAQSASVDKELALVLVLLLGVWNKEKILRHRIIRKLPRDTVPAFGNPARSAKNVALRILDLNSTFSPVQLLIYNSLLRPC